MSLGLYIHIPFCANLCSYCDFCKFINQKDSVIENYFKHLIDELKSYESYFEKITSIYIGGGTPNSVDLKYLKELFQVLNKITPIEYSIECNVEFVTDEFINLLKTTKVNRISLGIQTFNDTFINQINRFHNKQMCLDVIKKLNSSGFNNINIDMMYGFLNQTIDDLIEDLSIIEKLNIKHISYYSLILEEKSVFGRKYSNLESLIDNELEEKMFLKVREHLETLGFTHYEISNFSKEGYDSYHNKLYWEQKEYIGCGCSASSYLDSKRITNSSSLIKYYEGKKEIIEITKVEKMQEYFWLGMRLLEGVDLVEFEKKFQEDPFKIFEIDKLINKNLVQVINNKLVLTSKGLLFGNVVFSYFI